MKISQKIKLNVKYSLLDLFKITKLWKNKKRVIKESFDRYNCFKFRVENLIIEQIEYFLS